MQRFPLYNYLRKLLRQDLNHHISSVYIIIMEMAGINLKNQSTILHWEGRLNSSRWFYVTANSASSNKLLRVIKSHTSI